MKINERLAVLKEATMSKELSVMVDILQKKYDESYHEPIGDEYDNGFVNGQTSFIEDLIK